MSVVQPLRDFVLVTKEESSKQTASGLYMPVSDEKVVTGTVVAVGSGRVTLDGTVVPMEVKVEDKVCFNKNMAVEVKSDGSTFLLVKEEQLFCIVK